MIIKIFNRQKDLKIGKGSSRALVKSTLEHLKATCDEVSLYFVTEKMITQLHDQFFQDPTPTDCISFPIYPKDATSLGTPLDKSYLGEVFVCPSVAIQYAKKRKLDPYVETSLYVVHGLLHLLGLDDLETKARRTMRKKEKSCMRHLYKMDNILSQK